MRWVYPKTGLGPSARAAAAAQRQAAAARLLHARHVFREGPLEPLVNIELDPLSLGEGAIAVSLDRRVMNEDIHSFIELNEAESLGFIEPLHASNCHERSFLHVVVAPPSRRLS